MRTSRKRFALTAPGQRQHAEPTIALINIVFLMLIFFLIAGTLAAPLPSDMETVRTEISPPAAPPDALAIAADGTLYQRAAATTIERFIADTDLSEPVRIAVDRNLPARDLMSVVAALRTAGAVRVIMVTERAAAEAPDGAAG
ncbi:biopolymer transporter ExbD [Notoacmeibacter sp. MSK16QG-6]|uniref:ExbD/TolR family protein n=1 Tax=Notoacmeibacter sp. MSK16QG-6 TaxID=2957982 RepID=UPI0020A0A98A|nr:biopolymer transporter ExbD [Notoacmeibacter sp. MSK16QG-6]MCP1198303.1 biopolymer transporter ExbD [Notoacmeibacter sp. MSK16QG-6]